MFPLKYLLFIALVALTGCSSESDAESSNREQCKYVDYLLEETNENIAGLVSQGYSADESIRLKLQLEAERIERFCNKYSIKD